MVRSILAVVVAIIAAVVIMMIVEVANSMVMAPPSPEIMNDPARLHEFMANGPVRAYLIVLFGYIIASFAGGFVVRKISRRPGITPPLIVGGLLTLFMVANILMLPGQPIWFVFASLVVFIPVTLIGSRVAR